MKKVSLLLTVLFFASCQKTCYECRWEKNVGHQGNKAVIKTETFCNTEDVAKHDGKYEYIYDSNGDLVNTKCTCDKL